MLFMIFEAQSQLMHEKNGIWSLTHNFDPTVTLKVAVTVLVSGKRRIELITCAL